jgi:hypothetical protein
MILREKDVCSLSAELIVSMRVILCRVNKSAARFMFSKQRNYFSYFQNFDKTLLLHFRAQNHHQRFYLIYRRKCQKTPANATESHIDSVPLFTRTIAQSESD